MSLFTRVCTDSRGRILKGGNRSYTETQTKIDFRISPSDLGVIDSVAQAKGMSRSQFLKTAVWTYLALEEKTE